MNTPLNTPNGTIVKIVSFSLSQRMRVPAVIIQTEINVPALIQMWQSIWGKSVDQF